MDIKINSFIKKKILGTLRNILSIINKKRLSPYSMQSIFFPQVNISDFFVWNPHVERIDFIAENIRALFTGENIEVLHCFKFFSHEGDLISEEKHKSNDFFTRITLTGPPDSFFYSSFIHYIEAKRSFHDLVKIYFKKTLFFGEQNRGYCIYYPNNSLVGSSVHGNFGGIANNGKKLLARKRIFHLYTPAYRFESQNSYDLVFNNPTPSIIDIQIIFNNSEEIHTIQINSLGTRNFKLDNYSGSITFRSKLPVCRPILFKNVKTLKSSNFDVLHS